MSAFHARTSLLAVERPEGVERPIPPQGLLRTATLGVLARALWIGTGLWLLLLVLDHGPTLTAARAGRLGVVLGLGALIGQLPRFALSTWFRKPRGVISYSESAADGALDFEYSQRAWSPAVAEITCSLVLREAVEVPSAGGPATLRQTEHLIEARKATSEAHFRGGVLRAQVRFQPPADLAGRFSLGTGPLTWLVRVRVHAPGQCDSWEEFHLDVALPRVARFPSPVSPPSLPYQVWVMQLPDWFRPEATPEALLAVAPHLHRIVRLPVRAFETLSLDEAERVCRRLEAAGISVALSQQGPQMSRTRVEHLPIPVSAAGGPDSEALPIPIKGEGGVALASQAAIQPTSQGY